MKTAIGAVAYIKWKDEVITHKVYFSFSEEVGCPDDEDILVVDIHGVRDDDIFYYVADEAALKELIEYPSEFVVLSGYELVYK